jgi:MFS family permease
MTPPDTATEASADEATARRGGSDRLFYGWWMVLAAAGLQLIQGMVLGQAFGAYVVVLREEFGWSKTILSSASSLREMESGVMGPVQGWMLNKWGPRLICQLGLVVFAGGFVLFSRIHSISEFLGAFLIMSIGASMSGYLTLTYAMVQWFERRRATALSLTAAGGAIGGIMVRVTVLSMDTFGWRETALLSAALLLLVGLPLSFVVRWRPTNHGLHVDGIAPDANAEVLGSGEIVAADGTRDFTLKEAMRTRQFWFVGFGHGSALFVVAALNVHFISHLKESLGFTLGFATTLSLTLPLLFLVGTLLGGPIGDRFSKRWVSVACMWAHSTAILGLAFVTTVPLVLAFATLHGLAWGLRGPQMAAIRADYFGRTHFATILGVSNALIIIGTISGPVIAGYVYDITNSYRIGFIIVAALAAAGSLFFILAPKPQRPLASTPAR